MKPFTRKLLIGLGIVEFALDTNEIISLQTLSSPITTESLGTLQLSTLVPVGGTGDIIPLYSIVGSPSGKIHVLQFVLSAIAPDATYPAIASSDPIFVLLAPDGVGPVERLHHASLYLEQYLAIHGAPVPEPTSLMLLLLGGFRYTIRGHRRPPATMPGAKTSHIPTGRKNRARSQCSSPPASCALG